MLTGQGPLRGRPTDTLRLDPLDPWSARLFLPRLDPAAYLEDYAACGGYPLHLLTWDQSASTEQNLEHLGGAAGGILLEDAASIMSDELAEAAATPASWAPSAAVARVMPRSLARLAPRSAQWERLGQAGPSTQSPTPI